MEPKCTKTIDKQSGRHGKVQLHKTLPEHKRVLFEIQWYRARAEELRVDNLGIKEETVQLEQETTRLEKQLAIFEQHAYKLREEIRNMELSLLEHTTKNLQLL